MPRSLGNALSTSTYLIAATENCSAAVACRDKVLALLDAKRAVPPLLLLAVAAYFPLYSLRDAQQLLDLNEL